MIIPHKILEQYLPASLDDKIGLVGVGKFGSLLREYFQQRGFRTVLCDPPRSLQEAEELSESFFGLWGNGMGGCELTGENLETFLPLEQLTSCALITIQIPLYSDATSTTENLLTRKFLDRCRPDTHILCFSDPRVIAPDAANDSRIIHAYSTI